MRWRVSAHAVDRWCERVEPGRTRADANAQIAALLLRARHVGSSRSGQVYRLPLPGDPHVVVQKSDGVHVVVTVLDDEQVRTARDYSRGGRATPRGRMTA